MADRDNFDPLEVFLYRGDGSIPRNAVHVEVHRSAKFIPDCLFEYCDRLESLLLHEELQKIGKRAFRGCFLLRSFRSPSTVTEIGSGAFLGCSSLATVELPEGLRSMEAGTFSDCTSLEELRIPRSVARIGAHAFYGCANLASVELREGLLKIGKGAFACCRSLGCLRVPSSVVEIGAGAFADCRNLVSVRLHEHLPTMKKFAFRRCPPESFRFARLSDRMEAIALDEQTTSMLESRLIEITNAMVGGSDNPWENCKKSLRRAHDLLTYWDLKEAMPKLELALWRKKTKDEEGEQVDAIGNDQRTQDLGNVARVSKRLKSERNIDQEPRPSRHECRVKCGADIVIPEVLKFFSYNTTW